MRTTPRLRPGRRRASITRVAPVAVAVLVLAACSAGSEDTSPDGVLSLEDSATAPSGEGEGADDGVSAEGRALKAPTDLDQATALDDRCMKDAGFGALSGEGDGDGPIELPDDLGADGAEDPLASYAQADATCRGHLRNIDVPDLSVSPEQQAAIADAERAMVACMAEKGHDVSAMYGPQGGVGVDESESGAEAPEEDPAEDSPEMEQAMQECAVAYDKAIDDVFGGTEGGADR